MPFKYAIISLIAHAAVFSAAWWLYDGKKDARKKEPSPVFFEVVEEIKETKEEIGEEKKEEPPKEKPPEEKKLEEEPEKKPPKEETAKPLEEPAKETPVETVEKEKTDNAAKLSEKPEEENVRKIPEEKKKQESPKEEKTAPERAAVISSPVPASRISPVYPRSARRKGHEGTAVVEIEISENGEVLESRIASSSGHGELDSAALDAVKNAKFVPAKKDGERIRGTLRLPVDFKLK
jgi:protein TonB